ncbi:hypothetical protein Tco_1139387 [Tanacetum coccineum]
MKSMDYARMAWVKGCLIVMDGLGFVRGLLTPRLIIVEVREETDEDDSFDPTIHTPSHISSSDEEDSNNEIEGTNVEGAKSDEDATYEED